MAGKPPWFKFYARDWTGDKHVIAMSLEARGLYHWLLCVQWEDGSLPADLREMSRRSSTDLRQLRRIWPVLAPHFLEISGGSQLVNPRLEDERKSYESTYLAKSEGGKRGAKKRWDTHKDTHNGIPNSNQKQITTLPQSASTDPVSEPSETPSENFPPNTNPSTDEPPTPSPNPSTDEPPAPNPNGHDRPKRKYNPDNPWHDAVRATCQWFYGQPGRHRPASQAQRDHIANEVRLIFDRDMTETSPEDRPERLRAVLEAALADEFWSAQILSLAGLRKCKTPGSPPKWRNAEAKLCPGHAYV